MPFPWHLLPLQEGGASLACITVAAILGLLILILLSLMAYQRYVASKRPVQHLCDYCGHMVSVVSDCHHAPVKEKFLHGVCLECRSECRLVCSKCKRPV